MMPPVIRIEMLDHRHIVVAQRIHELLACAHAQEFKLYQAHQFSPLKQTTDDIQTSGAYFLGALHNDTIVGSISVGHDDEQGQISIEFLAVHPSHQRQGIGKSLLLEALRLGNGAPFSVVAGADNAPALTLYKKLGFVEYRRGTLGTESLVMVKLRRARSTGDHVTPSNKASPG